MGGKRKHSGPSISFNLEGPIAELFQQVREAAQKDPQFWAYGNLTNADLARFLLTERLTEMASKLGVLDDA